MDNRNRLRLSVLPLTFFSRLYGVNTISIDITNDSNIQVAFLSIVYGFVLVSGTVGYVFYLSFFDSERAASGNYIVTFCAMLYPSLALISSYSYMFNVRRFARSLNDIFYLSELVTNQDFFKKAFRVVLLELVFFQIMLYGSTAGHYLATPKDFRTTNQIARRLLYMFHSGMLLMLNIQLASVLQFTCKIFTVLNNDLEVLERQQFKLFIKRKDSSLFGRVINNEYSGDNLLLISDNYDITPLVTVYDKIITLFDNLNKCFGPSTVATSAHVLTALVTNIYKMMKLDSYSLAVTLMYVAYLCGVEWFIIHSSEKVTKETKRTHILIHNLLPQTKEQRLKDQLQQFSMKLFHQKVKFSACGMFPLNNTLIYSIAGAVTTYLVILIQMQTDIDL